jgi:formylglycine-generating enzyme required for sulfatase activity
VTWNDAVQFCNWLSEKEGRQKCYKPIGASWDCDLKANGFRLPTEAEWEYACRAGTTTYYSNGNDPESLATVGNVADGSAKEKIAYLKTIAAKDGYVFTAPVGRFKANAFGLLDTHGNVWEWCNDFYDEKHYEQRVEVDPPGPPIGSDRVYRGGGSEDWPQDCRSANRGRFSPSDRFNFLGFRLALVPLGQ